MKVNVLLTNNFDKKNLKIKNRICIVIDIIRTTSSITTILNSGAEKIIISPTLKQSYILKNYFKDFLLCGEYMGLRPDGFDYEISPYFFSKLDLSGKSIILKTTNGTKSYLKARYANIVLTLSFLNLNYTLDKAVEFAQNNNLDLVFICSGVLKTIAYEDALAAGLAIQYLKRKVEDIELDDGSMLVLNASLHDKNIYEVLKKTRSGRWTIDFNLKEDLLFSSKLNKFQITGKLEEDISYRELGKLYVIKPL